MGRDGPSWRPLPFIVHITRTGDVVTGVMDGIGGSPNVEIQNGTVTGDVPTCSGIRKSTTWT